MNQDLSLELGLMGKYYTLEYTRRKKRLMLLM